MKSTEDEYRDFVYGLMHLGSKPIPLDTICLGIVGGFAEFVEATHRASNRQTVIDEAGDVLWYITALLITIDRPTSLGEPPPLWRMDALSDIGGICEMVKRHGWHGKALGKDSLAYIASRLLWSLLSMSRATLPELIQANTAKLMARYPEGYVLGGGVR